MRPLRTLCVALLASLAGGSALRAQSLDAGALGGTVRDSADRSLPSATVTLTDRATGVPRVKQIRRSGQYLFSLLPPGDYDLLVERFGFRPRLIQAVPVRAGSSLRLDLVLAEGAGVDSTRYAGVAPGGSHLALDGNALDDELAAIVDPAAQMTGAAALLPGVGRDLASEGLPGRMGALALDGFARWSVRHPAIASGSLQDPAFPLAGVHAVEMLPGGMDVEWSAAGGGLLSGFSVPGSRKVTTRISLSGGPDAQTGSIAVLGPAVRDTAHFAFGISATHLNPQLPAPWPGDSLSQSVVATASDSGWTDLSRYQSTYKPSTTLISGFGDFDWQLTGDHRLELRLNGATGTMQDPVIEEQPEALGSKATLKDLSAAAQLISTFSPRVGNEFRFSIDGGSRDYTGTPLPLTLFTDGGYAAGTPSVMPGSFSRTSIHLGETLHYALPLFELKGGFQFDFSSFDQTYADGRAGVYAFGDTLDFARRNGSYYQVTGSLPEAIFKTSNIAGFLQGLFHPTATLELVAGVRYDQEHVPSNQLRRNSDLLRLTGINNTAVPSRRGLMSPRMSFTWTPDATRRLQVTGEAGRFLEPSDPGELTEALTRDAGLPVRRGFGSLGFWPAAPDSASAPYKAQSLTLLTSNYRPPQTGRARLGISGNVRGTVLRFQGAYRHTDYLPVRVDLNLAPGATGRDQDGRTIYGTLMKSGSLIGPAPGSNRRFSEWDDISSLDPAAASDYYGLSVGIERPMGRFVSLMASYTYSHTTDNWFGARAGSRDAQFVPFQDSAAISPWVKGRSDFDVPQRASLGAEFRFGGARGLKLVTLFQYRSGYPFTPGFRQGVDINGDGSASNDVAYVMDTLPGAATVISANSCLRGQIGRFAERNSCRDPASTWLDLRLAFPLSSLSRYGAEVTLDGLGLLATGTDVYDHALYLVDPAVPLVTTPGGVTRVPLVGNANFGKALISRKPNASFRLGIRMEL